MRERYGLNHGWRFVRRRASWRELDRPGDDWQRVDLPHSWNDRDTFQNGIAYYRGPAAYCRTFDLPAVPEAGAPRWHLTAGGFYGLAEVRLDGRRVGSADGQYLGFTFDVTRHLRRPGRHRLAIRMTNRCPRHVLPGTDRPDFLLHGGLAGGLFLYRLPALRILDQEVCLRTRDALSSEASVAIEYQIANDTGSARRALVRWTVIDPSGTEVGRTRSDEIPVPARGARRSKPRRTVLSVRAPQLWSPEQPDLYRVRGEIVANGHILDRCTVPFGMREAVFSSDGFFLNGDRVELRGFNRHESVPGLGSALPPWLHREDVRTIKELGGNFVRLSHYPQHPDFLDACDEEGLLVYSEIASWKSLRGGRWLRSAKRQMRDMILRDRNRPSVILWGMGNESQHRGAFIALDRVIKELAPDRPSVFAENHLYRARRARTVGLPDVWGCNYEVEALDEVRECSKLGAVLVSECCNEQAVSGLLEQESDQVESMLRFWSAIEGHPYVAGYALWAFNDYGTMFRDRFTRYTGKFDPWRVPKMSAALFAARHSERPFVKIFGCWAAHHSNAKREIHVVSNCERVDLRIRDQLVQSLECRFYSRATIDFRDEELVAEGWSNGQTAHDRLRPHGPGSRIVVLPERDAAAAAARDWVGVRLEVLDDKDVLAADWAGDVQIEMDGPARSGVYTESGLLPVACGRARTFIRGAGSPGTVRLIASAPRLEAGEAAIHFHAHPGRSREC